MNIRKLAAALSLASGLAPPAAAQTPVPHTFTAGTPARAADVNENFQAVVGQIAAAMPPGAVLAFVGATAPDGFLLCDGGEVSRTTYAALFAIIGISYGPGDGINTFKLPDLRGEFIRGADGGRGVDPGRALGTAQADELKTHTHAFKRAGQMAPTGIDYYLPLQNGTDTANVIGATGGTETRPRNVALNYIIKT
jgi:microcystin-dependent protein